MRVATAQVPRIEASDDKIFTTDDAVIVLDGASAFVPVPVKASLYADRLGTYMRDALKRNPRQELISILEDAIADTTKALDLEAGKSPSSTVTIARRTDASIEFLILGDNLVVLPDEVLTDDRMDDLDLAPRRKYRERLTAGYGYDDEHRALLKELQTQQANLRNRDNGYWIAEADPTAAKYAITATRPVDTTPWAVLATDGAYNTMEHIGLNDWRSIAGAHSQRLTAMLEQCQMWEAESDPSGRDLPRSKRHDDKALAVLQPASE